MKKTVIVLMGFIAVAMGFAACSSDDNNGSMPPENEETTDSVQTGTELVVDSAEVWSELLCESITAGCFFDDAEL